jgi:hypothetical protein
MVHSSEATGDENGFKDVLKKMVEQISSSRRRDQVRRRFGSGGRIIKRASTRDGSSRNSPRTTTTKPYKPNKYSSNERVFIGSAQSWESRHSRLVNGVKQLEFIDSFDITE